MCTMFITIFFSVILFVRMWVEICFHCASLSFLPVILFVRMWVEICMPNVSCPISLSSSSWGCELKYGMAVIVNYLVPSSSSWGCELKWHCNDQVTLFDSHPLREDVSWNIDRGLPVSALRESSSSWGCELKYLSFLNHWWLQPVILFVRMWVEIPLPTFF